MTWDEERIAVERAICAAASDGPWTQTRPFNVVDSATRAVLGNFERPHDATFTAFARTALPEALDVIAVARAYVDAVADRTNSFDYVDARWRAFRDAMNGGAS